MPKLLVTLLIINYYWLIVNYQNVFFRIKKFALLEINTMIKLKDF